jgi:hypothetical protein
LPLVAKALGVKIEDLVGKQSRPGKRGPAPKLQQQFELIESLPLAKQRAIALVLDSVLVANQ